MTYDPRPDPVAFPGVMVSSTFSDLGEHRQVLIRVISAQEFKPLVMEHDSARPVDVIQSSLEKVRKATAYIGIISRKYGPIPIDAKRNPKRLSLTELEFNEARDLGRPILLFIMGDEHLVLERDVETDSRKKKKLAAFRENAKQMSAGSSVHRVYKVFNDLHEFEVAATQAVAELSVHLVRPSEPLPEALEPAAGETRDLIPGPPAFYAEPHYVGSHKFVGRKAQLAKLGAWAAPSDPDPVFLVDAIGGTGKSMLTWEWTKNHAQAVRDDWAGRFWYSFYEQDSAMADFCQRALAYMTGRPLADFRGMRTPDLSRLLLGQLHARPWLLVLDGLERVMVAYRRVDAMQRAEDRIESRTEIGYRDPKAAIRPDDDELLRHLTTAAPSKLLLTCRLFPRAFLNISGQTIPGIAREELRGLQPEDAETLFRSCGIKGDSGRIRNYLRSHCGCHPLVTGALAGLINHYLPGRGSFDVWETAPDGGAALNLASLDLAQKQSHILGAALEALPPRSSELLSILALLPDAVDYATLRALTLDLRDGTVPSGVAEKELHEAVHDLEQRSLIQYYPTVLRYDLHPVVRGVAAGRLGQDEKHRYGQRVADHFLRQSQIPYSEAATLDDVRNGLHLVRALIHIGRTGQAVAVYRGGLSEALAFNLEDHQTILDLLHPYFTRGWATLPPGLDVRDAAYLANDAGCALYALGRWQDALVVFTSILRASLHAPRFVHDVRIQVSNIAAVLYAQNRLAASQRCRDLALRLADLTREPQPIFRLRMRTFDELAKIGPARHVQELWKLLDPMGRDWSRTAYRPGMAELELAQLRFRQGELTEVYLSNAEKLAHSGKDRPTTRALHALRGEWLLQQGNWPDAATSLAEAVRMARETGQTDSSAETLLALTRHHLGHHAHLRHDAQHLSRATDPSHDHLAPLWLALGDPDQARDHALAAYRWAWADGEPYVRRHALNQARRLLQQLGVPTPDLSRFDPAKEQAFPWEQEIAAAIRRL